MPLQSPLLEVQQNPGPALLVFIDNSGVPVALNRAARRFLQQNEQFGWADIIHSENLADWEAKLKEALDSQTQFSGWFRLRRFDNAIRQFAVNAEPRYDIDGTFTGCLMSGLDVSDLGQKVTSSAAKQESQTQFTSTDRKEVTQELAKQWHDALVKDVTVLKSASQLLLEYVLADCEPDPARTKAFNQVENAAAAICDLVQELNRLSREA